MAMRASIISELRERLRDRVRDRLRDLRASIISERSSLASI